MVKYGISTYGQEYVLDEEIVGELPWPRHFFILVIIGIYIITVLRSLSKALESGEKCRILLAMAFALTFTVYTTHFIDHSVRPVDCHEPRNVYQKYIWCEMEVGLLIFLITAPFGIYGIFKALGQDNVKKGLKFTFAFGVIINATPLAHYRIDPPWLYAWFPNFHIAGSGIMGVFLCIVVVKLWGDFADLEKKGQRSKSGGKKDVQYTSLKGEGAGVRRRSGGQIKTDK